MDKEDPMDPVAFSQVIDLLTADGLRTEIVARYVQRRDGRTRLSWECTWLLAGVEEKACVAYAEDNATGGLLRLSLRRDSGRLVLARDGEHDGTVSFDPGGGSDDFDEIVKVCCP